MPEYAKKVITLRSSQFTNACGRLQLAIEADGFSPDAVLAIARDGVFVAELMFQGVPHFNVRLSRPSTSLKGALFRRIVKLLPLWLLNRLRIWESNRLEHRQRSAEKNLEIPALPDLSAYRRVLVVDDAVDSGTTLAAVMRSVAGNYPDMELRSAAITVTTRHPVMQPTYALYRDLTLIRFPWAPDA